MTAMRTGSCTWLAAMPAPWTACIVSMRSSISACISGDASSSGVTSRARSRSTGWPTVAMSRTLIGAPCAVSRTPHAEDVAGGVPEVEPAPARELEDRLDDLAAGGLDAGEGRLEVVGLEDDQRRRAGWRVGVEATVEPGAVDGRVFRAVVGEGP